jgi:protein involved in polysaccharide export with SLBB domain
MDFSETTIAARRHGLAMCAALLLLWLPLTTANAAGTFVPATKLHVSVIQWLPTKGVYEEWAALGGEFIVSQKGTVELPVVGSIAVGDLDSTGLAAEISKRLQARIGLVDKPEIRVDIIEYPPIYVVGDVTTPGEYRFRPGLTALQALALGGGMFRAERLHADDTVTLGGTLRLIDADIIRTKATIARLEAETSGSTEISFPPAPSDSADAKMAADIFAQEKLIFQARANELDRQTKSLTDLRDLLGQEIDVLQEKIKSSDADIKSAEKELANVTTLVEKGLAVASRRTDLEHALAGFRTDRLDHVTAVMRARQGVTEATRNIEGLHDKQQTEVATLLQDQRAKLAELVMKQQTSQKLLLDALAAAPTRRYDDTAVSFTIVRRGGDQPSEISAVEASPLLPGDVVKVKVAAPPPSAAEQSAADPSYDGSISTAGVDAEGVNR